MDATEQAHVGIVRSRAIGLEVARHDPSTFCGVVLKDEQTGKRIEQTEMHDEWHDLVTEHNRLVIWSHLEAGKTQQLSVGRPLFELGQNPNLRIVIVSNTVGQAKKIIRTIAQYIEESEDLHAVFPRLVPTKNRTLPWSSTAITVDRNTISKDPSVQACGIHGNITGSRIDLLILDDILDPENTATESQMQGVWVWIKQTLMGRLAAQSKCIFIGNAWHPKDAMHAAAALPRFISRVYSVFLKDNVTPRWPARWPVSRLQQSRVDLGPLEFARQLECRARDDEAARFKQEWINNALELGDGWSILTELDFLPAGFALFCGVDLAVGRSRQRGDLTVFFMILLHPDGTRQIVYVEAGRITGPDAVRLIEKLHKRFGCVFVVENNAAQHYIVQFSTELNAASIIPFTTGKNKADPTFGVEGIAAEIAAGKWIIPSRNGKVYNGDIAAFVSAMLYYDPKAHTPDHLMGAWLAREGCRSFERGRKTQGQSVGVGVRVVG